MHFGLREGKPCWAKELLAGLQFVEPGRDWASLMLEMKPIESPRVVAQLAKFTESILSFDKDPTDPACPNRQHNTYGSLMNTATTSNKLATIAPGWPAHSGQPGPQHSLRGAHLQELWLWG